jgi:hypothetical protein
MFKNVEQIKFRKEGIVTYFEIISGNVLETKMRNGKKSSVSTAGSQPKLPV